jgi:hypothetical protein
MNPRKIDLKEKVFAGISRRVALIIGASLLLGLATAVVFPGHIAIKLLAAILVVGAGVALALVRIEGMSLEIWLIELITFRRRVRYRVKGLKRVEPVKVVKTPTPTPAKVKAPKAEPKPQAARPVAPRFPQSTNPALVEVPAALMSALVTVFMMGLLAFLALHLAGGGADRLNTILSNVGGF